MLGGLLRRVFMISNYKLGICPFVFMDIIQDRPWDTYGPNLSWGDFGNLRKDLEDIRERLLDQRDELIDQINTLQEMLLKHNIPLPPVKGV
jgi:hypothetical protein